MMRNAIIILTLICIGLLTTLVVVTSQQHTTRFDYDLLVGDWKEISESQRLTLKADSTFRIYIGGSGQDFNGAWQIKDILFANDTTSLLILKNLTEKKHHREDYFEYYFFQIDKLSSDKLKLTDLSGTLRRNKVNTFERVF